MLDPLVVPVVEPAVDPVLDPEPVLELEPYGFDELLDAVSELPKLTLVRMNCAFDDELVLDELPEVLLALPDVPVAPEVPA